MAWKAIPLYLRRMVKYQPEGRGEMQQMTTEEMKKWLMAHIEELNTCHEKLKDEPSCKRWAKESRIMRDHASMIYAELFTKNESNAGDNT